MTHFTGEVRKPQQIALLRLLLGFPERVNKGGVGMATQILIADDDPTIRLLLRRLLEKQ